VTRSGILRVLPWQRFGACAPIPHGVVGWVPSSTCGATGGRAGPFSAATLTRPWR
jgi:hypothetical protein